MACGKKDEAAAGEGEKVHATVSAGIASAEAQRFIESIDAAGTVTPRVGHVAALNAPGPTRVSGVLVAVGARVAAGDALVEFERAPFDAAVKSADAALATAQKAAERAQRLADAGVSPRREAEVAASDLAAAQATAAAAHRARELSTLRAPFAGVVTRLSAVMGAGVDAAQSLVEVADPSALDAVLTLSPLDARRVHAGQPVALHAGADATAPSAGSGVIADVSAAVDSASRGVAVRVALASASGARRIGETIFGRIAVGDHASAVVIPVEALVPTGEGFKVFVVDDHGIAMSRPVTIGGRSERGAWVTEGLKAGERVVTHGAYGVDDSTHVENAEGAKKDEPAGKGEKDEKGAKKAEPGKKP